MDEPDSKFFSRTLVIAAFALFLYFARDYPQWKARRQLPHTKLEDPKPEIAAEANTEQTSSKSSSISDPTIKPAENDSPLPSEHLVKSLSDKFSVRWIPYLPFAVIYLVLKAIWDGLRWFVLHSIFAVEQSGVHLMVAIEHAAHWSVNSGPEFFKTKVLAPIQIAVVIIQKSPVVAAIGIALEKTIFPGLVRMTASCLEVAGVAAVKAFGWVQTILEPTRSALEWFAIECVYNPLQALWSRLSILWVTFLQTAKIYLHELAKDAQDLGWALVKIGTWLWERTLKPLGTKFYTMGELVVQGLAQFLPWLAFHIYSRFLLPIGQVAQDGFRILRSHPTLLAGIHALLLTVKTKLGDALERLESVNWLILLETVLTQVVKTTYNYTTLALQMIWHGISVFAVDIVPNAYNDLMTALEVARPIVAWVVDKFVVVIATLWRTVYWISMTLTTYTQPVMAWLHERIGAPTVKIWVTTIQPVLVHAAMATITHTKALTDAILKAMPIVAATMGPVWDGFIRAAEVLQIMLSQVGARVVVLSGSLGERLQERVKAMGPQFEEFKTQTGRIVDEVVLATSNFMMDWVKKEKRD